MKKTFYLSTLLLLVLALMFSFTSCHKDGVYTPKRKISKIYRKYDGEDGDIERWHWNGELLDKIEYMGGNGSGVAYFKYNNKQLIEVNDWDYTYKFIYSGSKLSRIELLNRGQLEMDFKVTHTNKNKIIKIEVNEYYDDWNDDWDAEYGKNKFMMLALRGILPETTCETMPKVLDKMARKGSKGVSTYYITYTYEGNNIKEERYSSQYREEIYSYRYDKEKNPFYNLLYGGDSFESSSYGFVDTPCAGYFEFSKNNITHISLYVLDYDFDHTPTPVFDEIEWIYSYKNGYPIEKTLRNITGDYDDATTYYEYLK